MHIYIKYIQEKFHFPRIYFQKMSFICLMSLPLANATVPNVTTTWVTISDSAANRNLGQKIFHTIRWRRKWVTQMNELKHNMVW